MRILRSIRSVNPAHGGPIEGIKQVSAIHQRQGHTVEVLTLDSPDDPWVRDFPLPLHCLGPVRSHFGYAPGVVPWLRKNARNFDAVIVNGIWQYNSFGVWRALRGGPTPYFVFPHGMLDPWFKVAYPLKHLKKWLYWPWGEYRVLRDARAVFFTSEEERLAARRSFWLYRANEVVVNYGTSRPSGDAARQCALVDEQFPSLRGTPFLLFLGRIHEKKGCDLLIRAFAAIRDSQSAIRNTFHLVIAGPDQVGWQKALAALAEKRGVAARVLWPGMVHGDLKWGLMRRADAFILPSHQENFGIAVAEALACNVPVLISNKVNIWREVEADGAGLVDDDTLEGTARLLDSWSKMSDEKKTLMRQNAGACFESRFQIERAAESLIEQIQLQTHGS